MAVTPVARPYSSAFAALTAQLRRYAEPAIPPPPVRPSSDWPVQPGASPAAAAPQLCASRPRLECCRSFSAASLQLLRVAPAAIAEPVTTVVSARLTRRAPPVLRHLLHGRSCHQHAHPVQTGVVSWSLSLHGVVRVLSLRHPAGPSKQRRVLTGPPCAHASIDTGSRGMWMDSARACNVVILCPHMPRGGHGAAASSLALLQSAAGVCYPDGKGGDAGVGRAEQCQCQQPTTGSPVLVACRACTQQVLTQACAVAQKCWPASRLPSWRGWPP